MTTRSGRASHLHQSAPLSLSGRGGVWSGAGGPRRLEGLQPTPEAEAARVCSIPFVLCAYPLYRYRSWEHRLGPSPLGSHRVRQRQSPPTSERYRASWLTMVPAHCHVSPAGCAAHPQAPGLHTPTGPALPADLSAPVGVSARTGAVATRTTDHPSSLAVPSLAVAPPAAASSRVGLIEQSKSTRPAGPTPAGITQGEVS